MKQLHPYIAFENTKEALEYYETVFKATDINRLPVGEAQAEQFGVSKEEAANKTMHSEFTIAGVKLMASDSFGNHETNINHAISLMIDFSVSDEKEFEDMKTLFDHISQDSTVKVEMPLEKQFWGGAMGTLIDKYNIRWMFHGQK
ncbi:VOC family protein [Staphylococcus massiliensis]|uniref:Glyoxalase family protein n=1 Tax=Staphylococcus massiliensis S46 TaxID=1229783 RepID=K9AW69_9STAP|nr:VOC family protein [Staphylococcus massiliensis]EKU46792.1 Glyoxalase family protein [Staphylococcus massiliensis S46]MCG3399293.1 VOC family protein [Staphylococcus massiliensis]MCG3411669.1 VOC family protein [Staphylococcus massiliensis]POA01383.1 VOC family protein [Staphylococcus massiliensis CCUG 55927]